MPHLRSAALPRLNMSPLWDELRLDGVRVHGIRPRSRCWRALEMLMRKAPRPVTTEELYAICANERTLDQKGAVYNVIRRLRAALEEARPVGGPILQKSRVCGWHLLARCEVTDANSSAREPATINPEFTLV